MRRHLIAAALALAAPFAAHAALFHSSSGGGAPTGAAGGSLGGTYPNPTVATNANLTGDVTSVGNAATLANIPALAGTNLTGTAASLTAGHVTTNANLTGDVTSSGNAATLANIPALSGANLTTLNASNLSSGTVAAARGGAGAISGALKANGSGVVTQAACADLSNGATGCSTTVGTSATVNTGTSGGTLCLLSSACTYSGASAFSAAGAASTPGVTVSGAPFTGGSGTTTFPQLYVNSGTGPTTFSTSGTAFGVNAPSGFSGNFIDLHLNGGTSVFKVASSGAITTSSTINATSTITGGGLVTCNAGSCQMGYTSGAGGAVTQITNRTTGVTLSRSTGAITLVSAAGSATAATFTVTDTLVSAGDTIICNEKSGTNLYNCIVTAVGAGSFNITFYTTGGTATDAPVFNFSDLLGSAS